MFLSPSPEGTPQDGGSGSAGPPRRPSAFTADDILHVMPDGVVVADDDGRVTFVNRRAERLLGRSPAECVGMPVEQVLPLVDEAGRSWWAFLDPWAGLRIRTGHRERMLLLQGQGHVLVTMSFVRASRGAAVHRVIVNLRDTEAHRRAEAGVADVISVAAHELRGPLASVAGFSGTLLRRWSRFDDDQKRLMVETIGADAGRLSRLLAELLDVSRLDTGRLRLHREVVDLAARSEEHLARLVGAGHDPDRLILVRTATAPAGWADPDRLDQVLGNLLENALRHGAGSVRVEVSGPDPDGHLVVTVDDEGPGVSVEHRPLVFMKFWHGPRRGSTGLGLYLARGIVEAHGGAITVSDGPGGGARFRFTIPSAPSPDDPLPIQGSSAGS